jgi:hypothetical protein
LSSRRSCRHGKTLRRRKNCPVTIQGLI